MKYTQEEIIELAQNVELGDSIDWNGLNIQREQVYQIIGSQVYEMYEEWADNDDTEAVLLATITKLVVENYVLNIKLEKLY